MAIWHDKFRLFDDASSLQLSYLFSGQICLELPWVIPPQIVIMVGTLRLRGVNIRNNYVSSPGDDLGEGISLEGITFCRPPG